MGTPVAGWIVPQQIYSSGAGRFQARPSIKFSDEGRWGIRLKRALDMDFRGMPDGAQQVLLNETGTKIAVRIMVWSHQDLCYERVTHADMQWPGYLPWAQHMHAFDHTNARQPITKSRLVYDIARLVKLFFDVSNSLSFVVPPADS